MTNIAKDLLEIGAVFLKPNDPFTWASGIKSPIYCDNRLILSYPEVRDRVEKELAEIIGENLSDAEVLMGTATAGIAHAALIANILNIPMGYVRGASKKHGRTNQIEGVIKQGQKVVVIEDLISTGGSVLEAVEVLRAAGADVIGVVAIFTYGMELAKENFATANVPLFTATNFEELATIAANEKYIEQEDVAKVLKWKEDPKDQGWMK